MNIFNVNKIHLRGNCRICKKDFATKFDGKIFRLNGIVCHEKCIVSFFPFFQYCEITVFFKQMCDWAFEADGC